MKFGDSWAKAIRGDLKQALLMLVNGTVKPSVKPHFRSAVMARQINYNLFKEWEGIGDPEKKEHCKRACDDRLTRWRESGLANRHGSSIEVVKALAEVHEPIEDYFMTGYGLRLQNIDARIAFHVMKDMMASAHQPHIPTLPVHDSFITFRQAPWPQRLEDSMRKWYRHVMQDVTQTRAAYQIPIHKPGCTQDYVRETG
jgi:hypothetical protein